jgi:hypothetical protein
MSLDNDDVAMRDDMIKDENTLLDVAHPRSVARNPAG